MSIRMRGAAVTGLALAVTAFNGSAFAHHPGGPGNTGGAGPINTISAATLPQGTSVIAVDYEYIALSGPGDAVLAAAAEEAFLAGEDHAHVHSIDSIASPSLTYAYGVTNDLTLSVRLPYVVRRDIREGHYHLADGEGEAHARGNSAGIGDLSALAEWRVVEGHASGFSTALLLGVKAPTGDTGEKDREGERFEAEFQPGSGSWDGMFGLAMTQRLGAWSLDGSVLYTAVGTGAQDTNLGDRLHYSIAVSYRLTGVAGGPMYHGAKSHDDDAEARPHAHAEAPRGPALDLVLELNGEWHDKQREGAETDDNSGGNVIYLAPGLRLSQDKWSGYVSVGIPVVNNLNGIQSEPDVRVVSGLSLAF